MPYQNTLGREVKEVVLKSGNVITADVLIVGIEKTCSVSLLQFMRTNVPDVFCAGDLASFPLAVAKNQLVNIGHWQMAQAQGYGEGYTELIMKGNYEFEERKFLALYIK
ncbi:hypothetical protein XENOCAPTIV_011067 [Xenoophorus captivus]|uniref:FAD/NAD(P)-binding domain-containing protein n=1 Tax=Xenoophorus captivus TaxID=1517983 RepID=A0ABV0RQ62_9TELE